MGCEKLCNHPTVDPGFRNLVALIIRCSLSRITFDKPTRLLVKTRPIHPYCSVGPLMEALECSSISHSLRQEFLLRVHMIYAIPTMANARDSVKNDSNANREEGKREEMQQWYMTAYRRLVITTSTMFQKADASKDQAILATLDVLLTTTIPEFPEMFLLQSDNLQTLLFSNELSKWSLKDQRAIMEGRYWTEKYDLIFG